MAFLIFIMCHETRGLSHELAIFRMFEPTLNFHNDGLGHLVADDHTFSDFSKISFHLS